MAARRPQRSSGEVKKILEEARARFKRANDWEATARTRFKDDVKFAEGDAYNNYQWPDVELDKRKKRPSLTINRVRQHNLDILNDARQSRVAVKVRPLRDGASYESANILDGVIKHIEYISHADAAYQMALKFAVQGGIGWVRLVTDYAGDDTFDQEIYIRPVPDPMSILLDPDIKQFDGSDAKFGFVFTDMPKAEFDRAYPKYKDIAADNEIAPDSSWMMGDKVRIAEYFRCVPEPDALVAFNDPTTGEQVIKRKSQIDKDLLAQVIDDPETAERQVVLTKVEHFKIIGDNLAEDNVWPGKYIPLLRCVGEETVIDGVMDRKGHTRALLDSQRMYNYNAALSLETPLPTPTGWTKMGDVRPGDILLDEYGHPAEVDGLSPIFLFRDCYRVEFDDGSSIVTDGEHKWIVEERGKRVAAGHQWAKVDRRTDELQPGKHFIWQTEPLALTEKELPVDPYVFGYWLGNGAASGGRISCHSDDVDEIRGHISAAGYGVSEARPYKDGTKCADFTVFGLVTALRALGVVGNKHIPAEYLRASRRQREALLQGLMDSDGNISAAKQCSFQQSNEAISEGFAELLRSLGLKATYAELPGRMAKFPGGHMRQCAPSRRYAFSADPDQPVFRLARKAGPQAADRPLHPRRTKRHRIVSVTPVPWVPVRCLSIATKTHLYLAGDGMVPTHNSASVEYGALQTKVPWIVSLATIEETQTDWENANTENKAFLAYKEFDDDGNKHTPPQRPAAPSGAPVFMQGMRDALEQMYLASGQNQADFGQPSNEKSGVAIENRKREGDKATYHYVDHQSYMIRLLGVQLLDLIANVYDTQRIIQWRDEAGNEGQVSMDPEAPQHFAQEKDPDGNITAVMNPKMGSYDVQADVGPAYATRRQEAFAAFSTLLGANKELFSVVGDIWMRFSDIPGAEEASERLKRLVPSQALGDGPTPEVQHLQEQVKQAEDLVKQLTDKLADRTEKNAWEMERNSIKGYDSVTQRVKALEKALGLDPDGLMVLVREVIEEAQHQSAGGNADMHVMEPTPQPEDIHPGMGGQLQAPAPQPPALDPNKAPEPAEAAQ